MSLDVQNYSVDDTDKSGISYEPIV